MTVIPDLGPLFKGGKSVLTWRMTHLTGGLPAYIAWDDAFLAGIDIIAPEPVGCDKRL